MVVCDEGKVRRERKQEKVQGIWLNIIKIKSGGHDGA